MTRAIVMMGPPIDGRGGMAALVSAYQDGGLFQRLGVRYISTTGDGSRWSKLGHAVRAWFALVNMLVLRRAALLHIHVASGASFWRKAAYFWAARAFGVPVVWHVHGGNFSDWATTQSAWVQRFIRASFKGAACTVVLSASWISRLSNWVPSANAVPLANAVASRTAQRPARPGQTGARRFLFLGRLEEDKGTTELLQAFAVVASQHNDARLVLAGEGDLDHAKALAQSLGIAHAVEMPGWITGASKWQALDDADAFVLPSYIEALPVSMLEAMQAGLPVVVSAVGSIPEVIESGRNGLLVPPRNVPDLTAALLQLAGDAALCQRLANAGKASFSAAFSVEAIEPKLAAIWSRVAREEEKR